MARQKKPLSAYGRWLKLVLMNKDMTLTELSEISGVDVQYISKMMHGYFPGWRYRDDIQSALGETPPPDIQNAS